MQQTEPNQQAVLAALLDYVHVDGTVMTIPPFVDP